MSSPDSQVGQPETCPACGNVAAVPTGKTGRHYKRTTYVIVAVVVALIAFFVWWSSGAYRDWADAPIVEHSTDENGLPVSFEYTRIGHKILRKWETTLDGMQIITRYDKNTGKAIHLTMALPGKKGHALAHLTPTIYGPVTESGKRHGKWTTSVGLENMGEAVKEAVEHDEILKMRTEQWYWYGEKVSEGEFHLRDRR